MNRSVLAISSLFLTAGFSHKANAATALIDFGIESQVASGYNQVSFPPNGNGVTSGAVALTDTTTAATGWSITVLENGNGAGGDAGGGADQTTFPASLSSFANAALRDSMFGNGTAASLSVTISGLDSSAAYDLLFYGARQNAQNASQTWNITTGTGGSAVNHDSFNNTTTVVDWDAVVPDGTGTIAFSIQNVGGIGGALALNFGEITQVPEPSAALLLGLAGLTAFVRRRK